MSLRRQPRWGVAPEAVRAVAFDSSGYEPRMFLEYCGAGALTKTT